MLKPEEIKSVRDVIEWFESAMKVTPYGRVGVEVVMIAGKPVYVHPQWKPNIKIGDQISTDIVPEIKGLIDEKT